MKKSSLISFFLFLFSASIACADCNFKTGNFITELRNESSIQKIKIKVPKSAKFARNFTKILVNKGVHIPPELRKRFKADIIVIYPFGRCIFKGTVRQNGDFKDHIDFVNGMPIRSLDVKLKTGNIASTIAFKLLIPFTRGGKKEILASLIFRKLNIISPKTFAVMTNINGVDTPMLFQEKARKELLENNFKREGAIFEGDESIIWADEFHDTHINEKYQMSLSRMENKNWFKERKIFTGNYTRSLHEITIISCRCENK